MTQYSYSTFTGDGIAAAFAFSFDYLEQAHVSVVVDGVTKIDGTDYDWTGDKQITFRAGSVPASGEEVVILRDTPEGDQIVQWNNGSYIIQSDLNESDLQWLYNIQEQRDWLQRVTGGGSGVTDLVTLGALGDVTLADPVQAPQFLSPDPTSGKWVNRLFQLSDIPADALITEAKQNAGVTPLDINLFTALAAAKRFDNLIQKTLPPGTDYQIGKLWLQDDANLTLSMWGGLNWLPVASGGTFLTQPTIIYVDAVNGNDAEFDGHRIISPMRTIRAAVAQANTPDGNGGYIGDGWIIYCAPGVYQEEAGIEVYARNLSIKGASIRSTFIHPTSATETTSMFRVASGFYLGDFTIAGLKASGTRGSGGIDPDPAFGLPPVQAWVAEFRPGAYITKSPYIQNCTNFADSAIDNDNFDPNNLPGEGGDLSSAPTGGGILVDGAAVDPASPLRSFVVDAFTQIALNGPGVLATNNGYAQLVSFFGTFCWYHAKSRNGGQLNLSNCTTDFGEYGLIADGKSAAPIFTAAVSGAQAAGTKIIPLISFTRGTLWEPPREMTPADHMVVEIDGVLYPIVRAPSANEVEIFYPRSDDISSPDAFENDGLTGAVADGATCKFYLQSYISTGGHTFEYTGSGTDYRAHPDFGGIGDETKQVVEIGGVGAAGTRIRYVNGGRVWQSSTDENGRFRVGETFEVDQKTGKINLETSAVQIDNTVRAPGVDLRGYKLYQDPSNAGANADLPIEPAGTGSVVLGEVGLNSDGERVRPSPIMAPILEETPPGYQGISTEQLDRSSPVVTEKDVGYDADQLPVAGLLGKLAFADIAPAVAPSAIQPAPGELRFEVSGTTLIIKYQPHDGSPALETTLTLSLPSVP